MFFPLSTHSGAGEARVDDENCPCTWEGGNVQTLLSSSSTGAVVHYLPFSSEHPPLVHPHIHRFQLCCSRERRFAASSPGHCCRTRPPAVWCSLLAQPLAPVCAAPRWEPPAPALLPQEQQQHLAETPPPESSQNSIPRAGKEGLLGTALELNRKHPRFPRK